MRRAIYIVIVVAVLGFRARNSEAQECAGVVVSGVKALVFADDASFGAALWQDVSLADVCDQSVPSGAHASLNALQHSHYLRMSSLDVALSAGEPIYGLKLHVKRKDLVTGKTTPEITDSRVRLRRADGTIGTTDKAQAVAWPNWAQLPGEVIYGSYTDTWGESGLTGADLNDDDFGFVLAAKDTSSSDKESPYVDCMTVDLCMGPANTPTSTSTATAP